MGSVNLTKSTVNLSKGQKVNLSKIDEQSLLRSITIGLGWDPVDKTETIAVKPGFIGKLLGKKPKIKTVPSNNFISIDCDAWVALLDSSGKPIKTVYYGSRTYDNDAVYHHGDNLTGDGDGDDEQITLHLDRLKDEIKEVVIGVTIYSARNRGQSFNMINNLFVRVVDNKNNFEICRYSDKDFSGESSSNTFIAGRLIKEHSDWNFEALGICDTEDTIECTVNTYCKRRMKGDI